MCWERERKLFRFCYEYIIRILNKRQETNREERKKHTHIYICQCKCFSDDNDDNYTVPNRTFIYLFLQNKIFCLVVFEKHWCFLPVNISTDLIYIQEKNIVIMIILNSIIMIPPTGFFWIIRGCTNIPIIIRWTTLERNHFQFNHHNCYIIY